MIDQFLWCEKYRPQTINDSVLPKQLKDYFKSIVEKGEIQNMLFCGSAGTGKTTVARALCEEIDVDYILINGSEESGIDVLRNKIRQFASTVSFSGGTKVVILDEADYLNPNSTQPALRGFIEEFAANCRFIFTCNYKNRIIPALHSRCAVIDFKIPNEEKPQIAGEMFKRLLSILKEKKVEVDTKVLVKVVTKYFPDFRRTINELQRYAQSGFIDEGILLNITDENVELLIQSLKDKNWKTMRAWVVENINNEPHRMFRLIYDSLLPHTDQVPQLVMTIADYQYKSAFVTDQEINYVACLTELMTSIEVK